MKNKKLSTFLICALCFPVMLYAQDLKKKATEKKTAATISGDTKIDKETERLNSLHQPNKRTLPPGLNVTELVAEEYRKSGNIGVYKFKTEPALNKVNNNLNISKGSQSGKGGKTAFGNPNDLPSPPGSGNQKTGNTNQYQALPKAALTAHNNNQYILPPPPQDQQYQALPNAALQAHNKNQYTSVHPLLEGQYQALPNAALQAHNNNQYTSVPPLLEGQYQALPNAALQAHNKNQYTSVPPLQQGQYGQLELKEQSNQKLNGANGYANAPVKPNNQYGQLELKEQSNQKLAGTKTTYTAPPAKPGNQYEDVNAPLDGGSKTQKLNGKQAAVPPAGKSIHAGLPQTSPDGTPVKILGGKKLQKNQLEKVELEKIEKEKLAKEKLEKEKLEKAKLEKEKLEKERLEKLEKEKHKPHR
jgi:hypothetical protein